MPDFLLQLAQAISLYGLIFLLLGWHAPSLERLAPAIQALAWGSILGAMGALSIATNLELHGDVHVDARAAMVVVAALATAAYRYALGGPLMVVSVVAIALTFLGTAAVRWRARNQGTPGTA